MTRSSSKVERPTGKPNTPGKERQGRYRAYLLVKIAPGSEDAVLEQVRNLPHVLSSDVVYGASDMIIHVDFDEFKELQKFVYSFIHTIKGVEDTDTFFVSTIASG